MTSIETNKHRYGALYYITSLSIITMLPFVAAMLMRIKSSVILRP
jgi:hypothetical protein